MKHLWRRLVCLLRGHKWEEYWREGAWHHDKCARCGDEIQYFNIELEWASEGTNDGDWVNDEEV